MALRIAFLGLVFFFGVLSATVPSSERGALVDFYNSLHGPNWSSNTNWLTGDPCLNAWSGVYCKFLIFFTPLFFFSLLPSLSLF